MVTFVIDSGRGTACVVVSPVNESKTKEPMFPRGFCMVFVK